MSDFNDKSNNLQQIYNYLSLAVAGFFGVFVRHIYVKKSSIIQRLTEYLAGSICAIYGANLLARILACLLENYHIYDGSTQSWQKIVSFSAFLCGMFGLSLCEFAFEYLQKYRKNFWR